MPATEFNQPARQIGGGGRGRLGLAVWVLVLAGIVGFGILGRPAGGAGAPDPAAAATASLPPGVTEPADAVLVLTEPSSDEIRTVAVHVRGRVTEQVRDVQVFLRSPGREAAWQIVRPSSSGRFGAVFTLGGPRPAGEGSIRAVGLDGSGMPLGSVSRSFRLSALTATAVLPSITPRPKLGEDGFMGALALDLPEPAPTTPTTPRPRPGWSFLVGQLGWRMIRYQR